MVRTLAGCYRETLGRTSPHTMTQSCLGCDVTTTLPLSETFTVRRIHATNVHPRHVQPYVVSGDT